VGIESIKILIFMGLAFYTTSRFHALTFYGVILSNTGKVHPKMGEEEKHNTFSKWKQKNQGKIMFFPRSKCVYAS
jgi:hypothetical protein